VEKASKAASAVLETARQEAEELRRRAREEGYAAGIAQAEEELEQFRAGMAESVAAVLSAVEGQCSAIFEQWRGDLTALLRLAVEKGCGLVLTEQRQALLESLYMQSVTALSNKRSLVIRSNPEDEPVVADIVALTQAKYPDLKTWSVKADPGISPGGIIVENEDSLVDNRTQKRRELVDGILASLVLPSDA
jgi:flagellar assembly protein FliH